MPPLKNDIKSILESRSYTDMLGLKAEQSRIMNRLISMTYDKKNPAAWRAIEAIGILSAKIAETDTEFVRNLAGRLLWMIRDESGGIGWSAPEILGEIVRNNPVLCVDLAPVIASFAEEKMLEAGVMRALSRIGRINKETVDYGLSLIRESLRSDDPEIRGNALLAFSSINDYGWDESLDFLLYDESEIDVYRDGELVRERISKIAAAVKSGQDS